MLIPYPRVFNNVHPLTHPPSLNLSPIQTIAMKLAILSTLLALSSAFQGPTSLPSPSTSLYMSDAAAVVDEAPAAPQKVPCFGATPWLGGPKFIGENYWDKLTMEYGSASTGTFLRAAELKHGRSAMLAKSRSPATTSPPSADSRSSPTSSSSMGALDAAASPPPRDCFSRRCCSRCASASCSVLRLSSFSAFL